MALRRLSLFLLAGTVTLIPEAARPAEPPVLGTPGAPVTVEVYCDFLCPICADSRPALRRLLQAHPGQVRFVMRYFPGHAQSGRVAEAAACAADQGKFWEMREFLYDQQRTLSEAAVLQEARLLGMDGLRFDRCVMSGVHAAEWQRDRARGRALGVSGTPSFVVGRQMFEGLNEAALDRAIRRELSR
jgi:protein-disulfide isomerase